MTNPIRPGPDNENHFVGHEPCPSCGSKDNLARYSDGHAYCFGCSYREGSSGVPAQETTSMADIIQSEFVPLNKRSITESTCSKWDYGVAEYKGTPVQVANYKNESGKTIAQKLRFPNKDFLWLGDTKKVGLWGSNLWRDGGKMVTITEGEVDALTVSQLFENKWPVVSLPNGAAGAAKSIAKHVDWLEKFDQVIFCFDQDEAGRKAANDCAFLLSPGKAKIVTNMPGKDANDCLVNGKGAEVIDAIWGAKVFRPDGVVAGEDLWDVIVKDTKVVSVDYPWPGLNDKLFGIRQGELVTLTSGTGIGKSSV